MAAISRVAMARMVTVIAWMPALPLIEATIGIRIASATICSIVAPKRPITAAAKNAVTTLTSSHGMRLRAT